MNHNVAVASTAVSVILIAELSKKRDKRSDDGQFSYTKIEF